MSDSPPIQKIKIVQANDKPNKARKKGKGDGFAQALNQLAMVNMAKNVPTQPKKTAGPSASGRPADDKASGKPDRKAKQMSVKPAGSVAEAKKGKVAAAGADAVRLEKKPVAAVETKSDRTADRSNKESLRIVKLVKPVKDVKSAVAVDARAKSPTRADGLRKGSDRNQPPPASPVTPDRTGRGRDGPADEVEKVKVKVRDKNGRSRVVQPKFARGESPLGGNLTAKDSRTDRSGNILHIDPNKNPGRSRGKEVKGPDRASGNRKGKGPKAAGRVSGAKVENPVSAANKESPGRLDGKIVEFAARIGKDNKEISVSAETRPQLQTTATPKPAVKTGGGPSANPFNEMARSLGSQIIRSITYLAGGEAKEMLVRLEPPELGRLQLRLVLADGELSARLVVDSQKVKDLVESQLPQLRQGLQDQGFQVDKLLVETRSEGQTAFEEGRNDSAGSGRQTKPSDVGDLPESTEESVERPEIDRLDPGRIDFLV